ncbi:MAG TPA: ComEC/Rec2 family competence protein [Candidatus Angelobacter sp.]|nr:ComEC/Rec2 family competence protein [Candidatus Angelobacter sp.]
MQVRPRVPLALAAVALAGGIWLAGHWHRPPSLWALAAASLAICAIAGVAGKTARLARLAALLALVCAGAFVRLATPSPRNIVPPPEFLDDEVAIVAHVTNDGVLLASGSRERIDLQTESIELHNHRYDEPVGIRATVYIPETKTSGKNPPPPSIHMAYGDRVRLTTTLRVPRNFRNPGAFDYEGYLHGLGITVLASVKEDEITLLKGTSGTRLGFWRSRIRHSILAHLREKGLWNSQDAPIFAAMIMGDDSALMRDVREEFQETGVYHLLVVSGMNVALLAFAVFWLARRLRAPEWAASLLTVALAIFYANVAGMGVPIMRAVLMLSVFLGARLLYRDRNALNATGFAALVVLVLSPMALFEAGFQLTFLALLAISGISLPILQRTSTPYRSGLLHLESTAIDSGIEPKLAQFRLDLRIIAGRLARFIGARAALYAVTTAARVVLAIYELTVVSGITQAVLVLPMRSYFHRAAIVGLPANVLVLPLAGLMLNSGVAAIALSYFSLPLARVAAMLAAASLHWTLRCLTLLSSLHIAQWRVPDVTLPLAILASAGILAALLSVRLRRGFAFAGIGILFVTAGTVAFYSAAPRTEPAKLEVTAIDVGQGDSLLIVSPEGRTMLIDAGGSNFPTHSEFDFGEDVVAPYLWSRGIYHLDLVVLTHAHGDHIGGLARIVQDFQPKELWVGVNPATPALKALYETAAANHVRIQQHTTGEVLQWGGTTVRVLSPPADWQPKLAPSNDDSLALLITFKNSSALLAGDLERKMERFIAAESPRADLLKVAHHGSATSTTPELLAAVKPRFAVISVGDHNRYGHPRPIILQRLQLDHVQTYRTDMFGAVTFLLDGSNVVASVPAH